MLDNQAIHAKGNGVWGAAQSQHLSAPFPPRNVGRRATANQPHSRHPFPQPRQLRDRLRLVLEADVRVEVQRQPDVAVTGKLLGIVR